MALFGRQVSLAFGTAGFEGREFTDLRVRFRIDQKSTSDPHKGIIEVWGLSKESSAILQDPSVYVRLSAGYETPRQIFEGEPIRNGVRVQRIATERQVKIEAMDGGRTYQDARVEETISAGTTFREALDRVMGSFDLPIGKVEVPDNQIMYTSGTNLSGPSRSLMDSLAESVGASWFINDGVINFVGQGKPIVLTGPLFSVANGNLIGSPTLKDEGVIELVTMLDPDMRPGTAFRVESEYTTGDYTAQSVTFVGDSHGFENQFYCRIIGVRRNDSEVIAPAAPEPGSLTFGDYFDIGVIP